MAWKWTKHDVAGVISEFTPRYMHNKDDMLECAQSDRIEQNDTYQEKGINIGLLLCSNSPMCFESVDTAIPE